MAKGPHAVKVIFTDLLAVPYNHEVWRDLPNTVVIWKGGASTLEITQPDGKRVKR